MGDFNYRFLQWSPLLDARRSGCTDDQFIQELFRETPKSSDGLFHGLITVVPKSYGCTTTIYYYSCIFRKKVPRAAAPGKNHVISVSLGLQVIVA